MHRLTPDGLGALRAIEHCFQASHSHLAFGFGFLPEPHGGTPDCGRVQSRSGSMEECRDATISGFNEYVTSLGKARTEDGVKVRVTLTTFNDHVDVTHFRAPLDRLQRLTRESYLPDGSTAMLDAVGLTIDRLERAVKDAAQKPFVVCIISDGLENASRHFTYPDIAQRI